MIRFADIPIPRMMRAPVLRGPREMFLEDRPVPRPGPGEMLIRVSSVGICGSDVHYYKSGRIGDFVVEAPLALGHEVSAVIVAAGIAAGAARIGTRVALEPGTSCGRRDTCKRGSCNLCRQMRFYATPPRRALPVTVDLHHPDVEVGCWPSPPPD